MYAEDKQLRENTRLVDTYFPFNIFHNIPRSHNVLRPHWHEYIEILYIAGGHAVFYIGTEAWTAVPGDILFVNSGVLHSGYSVDDTQVDYYAIVFDRSLLASYTPDPYHNRYIAPFTDGNAFFPVKIGVEETGHTLYAELLKRVIGEFDHKAPAYEIVVKAQLYLLVVSILRDNPGVNVREYNKQFQERYIEKFKDLMDYVEKHFDERITVETAARLVSLSPYHFCKTFKKMTGRTFIEFINMYRVNEAEDLIRNTALPISRIAEKVGFCNINYFDKIYKKYKRYSPSKGRKNMGGGEA